MSYIRSISNPEGLYIINDGSAIEIMERDLPVRLIPIETWHRLLVRVRQEDWDIVNGEEAEEQYTEDGYRLKFGKVGDNFKWLLTSPATPPPPRHSQSRPHRHAFRLASCGDVGCDAALHRPLRLACMTRK